MNIRFSYAEGFRAPQAFDEDLHISNVGGELVSIVRAKGLKEERSRSFNASVDWYHYFGDFQANLLVEGFYTKLSDPFVLTPPVKDPDGSAYLIQTRINGSGAKVYGGTLEGKVAYKDKVQLQAGLTLQEVSMTLPKNGVRMRSTCRRKNVTATRYCVLPTSTATLQLPICRLKPSQ